MGRKLWTMPMLGFLRGTDARPIANGFQTIGEYLRGHVGFWGFFSGTTDANGRLIGGVRVLPDGTEQEITIQ